MKSLGQMMKQAQQMQAKVAEMQAALDSVEVTGAAGGGMVAVTLTGKGEMRRIRIDPQLVVPAEVEVLEDLILAAVNDARTKLDAHVQSEMAKITGGLQLPPGMKLPF
ncbi:MAG: YbaB/EbfC family nucleoid-associated protein [Dongiaceae bacterium]